jgi:hypothetical protein
MAGINIPYESQALTGNGTATGYVTVADTTDFYIGARVLLRSATVAAAEYRIIEKTATTLGLRLTSASGTGRSSCAAYLTADSAVVVQNVQMVFGPETLDLGPGTRDHLRSDGDLVEAQALKIMDTLYFADGTSQTTAGGGGGSSITVKDEGVTLTAALTTLDFVGGAVTATNVGGVVTVTIPTVTTITGNAGTATALQNARTIAGVSFNGTANIAITTATVADSADKRYVTDAQLAYLTPATALAAGVVTTGAQAFAGTKTFDAIVSLGSFTAPDLVGDTVYAPEITADDFFGAPGQSAWISGAQADGASAVGVTISNTIALTTAGAKLLRGMNNGAEKFYFDKDGGLSVAGDIIPSSNFGAGLGSGARSFGAAYVSTVIVSGGSVSTGGNGNSMAIRGFPADGASAVAVKMGHAAGLANATSKIAAFYSDDMTTMRAYVSNLGGIRANVQNTALPAASSSYRGQIMFIDKGSGVQDEAYICVKDAADSYSWKVITLV